MLVAISSLIVMSVLYTSLSIVRVMLITITDDTHSICITTRSPCFDRTKSRGTGLSSFVRTCVLWMPSTRQRLHDQLPWGLVTTAMIVVTMYNVRPMIFNFEVHTLRRRFLTRITPHLPLILQSSQKPKPSTYEGVV